MLLKELLIRDETILLGKKRGGGDSNSSLLDFRERKWSKILPIADLCISMHFNAYDIASIQFPTSVPQQLLFYMIPSYSELPLGKYKIIHHLHGLLKTIFQRAFGIGTLCYCSVTEWYHTLVLLYDVMVYYFNMMAEIGCSHDYCDFFLFYCGSFNISIYCR